MLQRLLPTVLLLALAACTTAAKTEPPQPQSMTPPAERGTVEALNPTLNPSASARLINSKNEVIGQATFSEEADGVHISVDVGNLTPGPHGWHIHEVGTCAPSDFVSAGGHFNPLNREHGLENPQGTHAGDLPNLEVAEDGTAKMIVVTDRISLQGGQTSLFDADGSSLVIHAKPDDQMTNPAGNSGDRVACGAIETQ